MVRRIARQVPDRSRCPQPDPRPGLWLPRILRCRVEKHHTTGDTGERKAGPGRAAGMTQARQCLACIIHARGTVQQSDYFFSFAVSTAVSATFFCTSTASLLTVL